MGYQKERWKKADKLIAMDYTATEIGRQIGVSHVAVHKHLKRFGKYEEWKEKRGETSKLVLGKSLEELAQGIGATLRTLSWEEYQQILHIPYEFLVPKEHLTPDDLERAVLEAVRQYRTVSSNELYHRVGTGRNIHIDLFNH